MQKMRKATAILAALMLLVMACAPAAAADAGETVNILGLIGEEVGGVFYPTSALIVSLDLTGQTVRVVNFCMQTQVTAVTRDEGEMDIPMDFLQFCDTDEIVKAYENTFGITVDRHLFIQYEYGVFEPIVTAFMMLCPVTLDISDGLLGDEAYSPFNAYVQMIADSLSTDFTAVTEAGAQLLNAAGLVAYLAAFPVIDWENVDWIAGTMEDYRLWDAKCRAALTQVIPNAGEMNPDSVQAFWTLITDGQETDITADDIAAWSQIPFTFPDDPYLTVPGFESAEVREYDSEPLTDAGLYGHRIMVYDSDAVAAALQRFIGAD